MSNLQPNCCLEFEFRKVDQHAGGKWLIHDRNAFSECVLRKDVSKREDETFTKRRTVIRSTAHNLLPLLHQRYPLQYKKRLFGYRDSHIKRGRSGSRLTLMMGIPVKSASASHCNSHHSEMKSAFCQFCQSAHGLPFRSFGFSLNFFL